MVQRQNLEGYHTVSHQEHQIVFHLLGLAVDSVQDMIYTSQRNCLGHHNKNFFLIEYDQRCQIHKKGRLLLRMQFHYLQSMSLRAL